MNISAIILQHKRVCNLVVRGKVKQSLDIMSDMLDNVSFGGFRDEFEDLRLTYGNMLKYTIDGIKDPDRQKVYTRLLQSILKLNDRIKQDILAYHSGWFTYAVRNKEAKEEKLRGENIIQSVDDLVFKAQLDDLLSSAEIKPAESSEESSARRERLSEIIFNHLWLTDYYGDAEDSLLDIIRDSGKFQWYEMASYVSAITLSSLRIWDPVKLHQLVKLFNNDIQHVSERALTGLVLSLYYYDERVPLYPDVLELIREVGSRKDFSEKCRVVVLQIIRSRETEKLSRRMQDEILPKVVKLQPKIEEKLDLDSLLGDTGEEGRNPDWHEMFKDSEEIFKTMEELANLQMDGSDVYMSAFAGLKNFDFFKNLRNWFIPFYPDHEAVDAIFHDEILGPGINELAEALFKTPFICNSDKYSLVLNLSHLPAAQKTMMLKAFRMEMEGLEQMKYENALTDPGAEFRTTVTQYIHDLYRFFKLSSFKDEFEDLFSSRLDIYRSLFFRETCGSPEAVLSLADYFFSKDYYEDALALYLTLIPIRNEDPEIFEKTGYCYQQTGNYEEALQKYSMASLIDPKPWTLRKLGLCLRKLGRYSEALQNYLRVAETEPDDLYTVLKIAHCYLDMNEYDNALKYYFKVEYDSPGNVKILRPIAWCYLVTGRLREAAKYFERLSEAGFTPHDRINMGHLAFCQGDTREAAENYLAALEGEEISVEAFINIFRDDSQMLTANGVNPDDLPIVLDFVLMNCRS
ncbi:MAG TPA: tetratricopeptide repeat protein [Bacteroidales bacterium]|nr:tetratricopeptide repeat protein [Bacteroidales bacterium]